jgi:KDO2-lipid IV(A) lauroyltransferase
MIVPTLKALSWILARLPLRAALGLGAAGGWVLGSVVRFRRGYVLETLARCLPERSEAERRGIADRGYRHLGITVAEVLRLSVLGLDDLRGRVTFHGEEHLGSAATEKEGSLALMAHLGNWEAVSLLPDRLGHPCAVVVKPLRNQRLQEYLAHTRSVGMNMTLFYAKEAYRDCLRAIRNGTSVAMILDQNTHRDRGVFVDFFGRPACTTPGLALLAARTRRPVYPLFDLRGEHGRHELHILPPIEPPPDYEKETLRAFTQRYTRVLENLIREHPDQWLWLHHRWRTRPWEEKRAQGPA